MEANPQYLRIPEMIFNVSDLNFTHPVSRISQSEYRISNVEC